MKIMRKETRTDALEFAKFLQNFNFINKCTKNKQGVIPMANELDKTIEELESRSRRT